MSSKKKEKLFARWKRNRSAKIPIGRSFQTKDEYLEGGISKAGKENKGNYRKVFAVETNELDEMAVVKSTTSEKGRLIPDYNNTSKTRPFIHTKDDNGKPIKNGKKFIENPPSQDMPIAEAERIVKEAVKNPKDYDKMNKLKNRKK